MGDASSGASAAEQWTLPQLQELGVTLRSVNVLAHGELPQPVDIKRLALLVRNADYKPRGFGALVVRFLQPKGSILVYKSGKFLVLGAACPTNARAVLDKFLVVMQKVDFPHDVIKYTVSNIVNACDLKFRVRLEGLQLHHIRHCTYEPELFPGLIYRSLDPKLTLLVFVSGKIVITGAKQQEDAERILCKMFPVFLQFRLRDSDDASDDSDMEYETMVV